MEVNQRHVVSIDVLIGEQTKIFKDLSSKKKKHRLTILVGCQNQYPGRLSTKKNMAYAPENNKKFQADICLQKYYFNKKNKRDRTKLDGGLTQRKIGNGITASLCRGRDNSKSYRIHTIDYIEQQQKKQVSSQNQKAPLNTSTIEDETSRKRKIGQKCKIKVSKKSIISQTDLTQFTTITKDKDIKIKIKQKQGATINLGHRKYNKAKTQFEELQEFDNCGGNNKNAQINRQYIMSQRKNKEDPVVKKIQFKKNRIRSINSQSQKETLQLRAQKSIVEKQEDKISKEKITEKKNLQSQLKDNFRSYLDFINQNKRQKIIARSVNSRNSIKSRSFAAINGNPSLSVRAANCKSSTKQQKQKKKQHLTPDSKGITERESQEKKMVTENNERQLKSSYLELECSEIPEINQSSFLSSTGKKQIVLTAEFQVTKINNPAVTKKIKQNVMRQADQESPKQKRKKKESKMNLFSRPDLRQAFPDKFFC